MEWLIGIVLEVVVSVGGLPIYGEGQLALWSPEDLGIQHGDTSITLLLTSELYSWMDRVNVAGEVLQ